ncbi:hypothetical protein M1E08_09485 [Erwinia sp. PK3-005]
MTNSEDRYGKEFDRALNAAPKAPEWNGEGLPPVGCVCELYDCEQWNPVRIKYAGEKYVVTDRTDLGCEVVYCLAEKPERFRPLRTEAERKRDEACKAMTDRIDMDNYLAGIIYDDIAAGQIPHITLK